MNVYAVIDTDVIVSAFLTRHFDSATVKVLNAEQGNLVSRTDINNMEINILTYFS